MFSLHVKYSLRCPYSIYSAIAIFAPTTNTANLHFYIIKLTVH